MKFPEYATEHILSTLAIWTGIKRLDEGPYKSVKQNFCESAVNIVHTSYTYVAHNRTPWEKGGKQFSIKY